MLARLHQEGGACVACERDRIFGVLAVLNVGYRADFLDRLHVGGGAVADDETAALERELAFGLCYDYIERGFSDGDGVHRISALGERRLFPSADESARSWKIYPLGRVGTTAVPACAGP